MSVLNWVAVAVIHVPGQRVGRNAPRGLPAYATELPSSHWAGVFFSHWGVRLVLGERYESIYYDILTHLERITRPARAARLNLVFIIDDLDRCLPEKAVQMLEAIKLFLDVPRCAFVLGLDEEVVERGIAHRYRDYNQQADSRYDVVAYAFHSRRFREYQAIREDSLAAPVTGHEYLEKIVHLAFRLPVDTATQVEEFLLDRYPELFASESVNETARLLTPDTAAKLLTVFEHAVPAVPRKLIRAAESLKLWLRVARRRGLDRPDPLLGARFVFMQQFAPELYRFGRDYPRVLMTVRQWWDEGWRTNAWLDDNKLKVSGEKEEDRYTWDNLYRPLARHLKALGGNRSGFQPSSLVTDQFFDTDAANLRPYFELVAQLGEAEEGRVTAEAKEARAAAEVEEPEVREAEAELEVEARKGGRPPVPPEKPAEPGPRPKPLGRARPKPSEAFVPADPEAFFGQLFSSDSNVRSNAIEQEGEAIKGRVLEQKVFDQLLKAAKEQDDTRVLDWVPTVYPYLAPEEQATELAQTRFDHAKLLKLMQSREHSNLQRRAAGLLLGAIGWLPEDLDVLLHVKDELFVYGEGNAQEKNKTLGHDFWIAKYPVTNAQYQHFVDAGGYDKEKGAAFWEEEGRAWLEKEGIRAPRFWEDRNLNNPLFPMVGVSLHEARAYARWLMPQPAAAPKRIVVELPPVPLGSRLQVRLPIEEEWERAARGTDGREYSWGNEFETWRANTSEGEAGATTAVSTFPEGESPVGAWDMGGNVYEWTGSVYSEKEPYPGVRGGSWLDSRGYARSAGRYFRLLPENWYNFLGFRLVVSLADAES